jgi:hypothetical protein
VGATSRQNSHSGLITATPEGFAFTYLVAGESSQFVVVTDTAGYEIDGFQPTIPDGMAVIHFSAIGEELLLASYQVTYLPDETYRFMLIQKYDTEGNLLDEGYCVADTAGNNTLAMGTAFCRVGNAMDAAMLVEDFDANPPDYSVHVGAWPQERQVSWILSNPASNVYRLYDIEENSQQEIVLAIAQDDSSVIIEQLLFWACDSTGMPRGNPLSIVLPDSQYATDIMMASLGQSFYAAYSYGNLALPEAPLRIWLTAFATEDILPTDPTDIMPNKFRISAWPNPFNSSMNIAYHLPVSERVTLSIFDVLGSRVETLAQETQAPGMHRMIWTPTNHASGTYFLQMKTTQFISAQKVILLK